MVNIIIQIKKTFFYLYNFPKTNYVTFRIVAQRWFIQKYFKIFSKFTGKHLCSSFFFNKDAALRPASSKRNPDASVVLWILRSHLEHLLYKTPPFDCLWYYLESTNIFPLPNDCCDLIICSILFKVTSTFGKLMPMNMSA